MLKEEEEEIADEYRGLPYEERLQVVCFQNVLLNWISLLDRAVGQKSKCAVHGKHWE